LQGPIVDQLAEEMGEGVVIGKANVEEAVKISEEYGVMSIPTLLIFKDGQAIETLAGLQSKDSLTAQIKKYL
jgi:thioredoxin 1